MSFANPITLPSLCLASKSPRRRELLENLGLTFFVRAADAPEVVPVASNVDSVAQKNALAKALAAPEDPKDPSVIRIGADTLVVVEGKVLGKPKSSAEVPEMLRLLSGKEHFVVTGLALVSAQFGTRQCAVRTSVRFRKLEENEILDYAKTREPLDKAGSYAIQGLASLFVDRIEGSYTNVVGLPIEQFLRELTALSRVPLWRWFS